MLKSIPHLLWPARSRASTPAGLLCVHSDNAQDSDSDPGQLRAWATREGVVQALKELAAGTHNTQSMFKSGKSRGAAASRRQYLKNVFYDLVLAVSTFRKNFVELDFAKEFY